LLWLTHGNSIWLTQRPPQGVWAGLWTMPLFGDVDELLALTAAWPGSSNVLPAFKHALTHFDWALQPVRHVLPARGNKDKLHLDQGQWHALADIGALGLPAPIRKLLAASF
jgi:A/G-specific adenine glycosylase